MIVNPTNIPLITCNAKAITYTDAAITPQTPAPKIAAACFINNLKPAS